MSMSIVLDYWNRFDIVLNGAEFYKNYVVIDVSPPEEITKLKAEIKSYVEKGRILKESPLSEQLKNELLQLKFIDDLPSYYAALVGPSLMGKTQTAFTLSHSMNVFYVNFASFYLEMSAPTEQRIYRALGPLSKFFFKAVWADIDATNYLKGESNEGATFFSDDSRKFITLGLIYTLLKWKDLNSAEFDSHPEKWFSSFLTMKRIVIKSLTRDQFMSKMRESGLSVDDALLFSDELPYNQSQCKYAVCFLRNLCRVIHMPSMLSGTDSHVTNLIGRADYRNSGPSVNEGLKPWVKVVSKTPRDSILLLKCLGCSIEVNLENETVMLDRFIENDQLNLDRLINDLIGEDNQNTHYVKSVIGFLFEQLNTGLPGLITECINIALKKLSAYREVEFDLTTLWSSIVEKATAEILLKRKKMVVSESGIISTAHILNFVSSWRTELENDESCAKMVNEHFFLYGDRNDSIFDIFLSDTIPPRLANSDNTPYCDQVYFPELEEDFLLTILCLKSLLTENDVTGDVMGTLGYYHQRFLDGKINFEFPSNSTVQNSYALEVLANWSICSASHLSSTGNAQALQVLQRFFRNIQSIGPQRATNAISFQYLELPASLENFLAGFKIPFLCLDADIYREIIQRVSPFITMGSSWLTETNARRDVFFQAKKIGQDGFVKCFIECKLWGTPVGMPSLYEYYEKACKDKHPISIIVAKSFIELFEDPDALKKLKNDSEKRKAREVAAKAKAKENASKDEIVDEKATTDDTNPVSKKVKKDYIGLLEELWEDEANKINIYAVKFDKSARTFKYTALLEFDNPIGVFLIVNSTFNPPVISGTN